MKHALEQGKTATSSCPSVEGSAQKLLPDPLEALSWLDPLRLLALLPSSQVPYLLASSGEMTSHYLLPGLSFEVRPFCGSFGRFTSDRTCSSDSGLPRSHLDIVCPRALYSIPAPVETPWSSSTSGSGPGSAGPFPIDGVESRVLSARVCTIHVHQPRTPCAVRMYTRPCAVRIHQTMRWQDACLY